MIELQDLAQALDDVFTQLGEWNDDFDMLKLSGIDPDGATKFAVVKAQVYEDKLASMIAADVDMNEAIRLIIASAICDGLGIGVRAGRADERARAEVEE